MVSGWPARSSSSWRSTRPGRSGRPTAHHRPRPTSRCTPFAADTKAAAAAGRVHQLQGGDAVPRRRSRFNPQLAEGFARLLFEVWVVQSPQRVEAGDRVADCKLTVDDACSPSRRAPSKLGLRPDRAEVAGACADDRDRLVTDRVRRHRPRHPVERVLEHARDRRVVLGGDEEHARLRFAIVCAQASTASGVDRFLRPRRTAGHPAGP